MNTKKHVPYYNIPYSGGGNAGFMAGPNLDVEFPIPPGHPDHVPPGGGGLNNMVMNAGGMYNGVPVGATQPGVAGRTPVNRGFTPQPIAPRGRDYYRNQRYAHQAGPANPWQTQLDRLQRQFRELYRSNPGAAYALYEQGSGQNRGAMQQFIRDEMFGGDMNDYNNWKNTSAYTSANNYKYDPTTGRMSDLQGNVAHAGFGNTASYKPGSIQERLYGSANAGQPSTGKGTSNPNIDPYAGMTMLYRDNTGMLHDPGDNPVNQPPPPSTPTGGSGYYRPPSRRDQGMSPDGGMRKPGQDAANYYRRPTTGTTTGGIPGASPTTTPRVPTTPTTPPPAAPVVPPMNNTTDLGRDPNDPYKPNQNKFRF